MSAMERKVEEFGVTQKRILLFVLALVAFLVVEQNTGRIIDATKLNLKFNEIDLREDIPEDTVYHHKNKQRPSVSSPGATGELKEVEPEVNASEEEIEEAEKMCERDLHLEDYGAMPIVFLNSFPGAGNTWARILLEDVTGIYSGSVYGEAKMIDAGFLGEADEPTSGRTCVVKNHGQHDMEYADGIIYVIRNPYDATIADYKRQVLHSHTSSVDMSVFDKPEWKAFQMQHLKRWFSMNMWFPEYATKGDIPFHIMYYEDMKTNVTNEMVQILDFFEENYNFTTADRDRRLACLTMMDDNKMHRKSNPIKKELFSDEAIEFIEEKMRFVRKLYDVRGWSPMKTEYTKKKNLPEMPSDEELEQFILTSGHSIWRKIDMRLGYRKNYLESGLSAEEYLKSEFAPERPNA
jgi:hypothetical protein